MSLKNKLNNIISKYRNGGITSFQKGGMTASEFLAYLNNYSDKAGYTYDDVISRKNAILDWGKDEDVSNDGFDLDTIEGQNTYAGVIQQKMLNNNKNLISHYTIRKPFTKADIDDAISQGIVDKKWFENSGVKFGKDGKALRGTIESGMKMEDALKLSEEFDKILAKPENSDKREKFISKFNDNKWYYRRPKIQTVNFDDDESAKNFTKDYSDIGDGIYYSNKTGLYFKTNVNKPEDKKKETEIKTASKPILESDNDNIDYTVKSPILTPDQSNMAPKYFGTRLRGISAPWNVANFVSPDKTIREINKQSNTARELLTSANPYTSASAIANIQAQENENISNTIMQTELANQQAQNQTDAINEQRIQQTDAMNNQESMAYENRSNVGLDSYHKEWLNYFDRRNKENKVNYNLQNQVNAINAVNPNYNINPDGSIRQTGEQFKLITDNSGKVFKVDKNNKIVEEITKTDETGKVTGTTTKVKTGDIKKQQKGGLINSGNLKEFLSKHKKS